MTSITITPDTAKKRLRFSGDCIAAGEHIGVTVAGFADKIAGSKLRLRVMLGNRTLAKFPLVMPDSEADPPVVGDQWTNPQGTTDAYCELNLNTVQAQKYIRCGMDCWIVIDDVDVPQKYGAGELFIGSWCKESGEDTPYDLDEYPDIIDWMKNEIENFRTTVDDAKTSSEKAVGAANKAVEAAQTSSNSAATAQNAASRSESAAQDARTDADAARDDAERAEASAASASTSAESAISAVASFKSKFDFSTISELTDADSLRAVKNAFNNLLQKLKAVNQ